MKVALLHQTQGGYNRRHPGQVPAVAQETGIPCWPVSTTLEIERALGEIAGDRPDLLVVSGGDGTVDAVVTHLRGAGAFAREPMLALLAGGTTNMIARDVGLRGRPGPALRRIAAAATAGNAGERLQRSPLAVHGTRSRVVPLGFFLGGGALPGLLRKVQQGLHAKGFVGPAGEAAALLQAAFRLVVGDLRKDPLMAPSLLGWEMHRVPGASDGERETVLYLVTTLDRLVLGIDTARPPASLRFLALGFPCRRILPSLARLLSSRPAEQVGGDFIFEAGERLALHLTGELVLDGEPLLLDNGPVSIEVERKPPLTFWRV